MTAIIPEIIDDDDYKLLVEMLDMLTDRVGEDETHPLARIMDMVGVLIENYEVANVPALEPIGQR
jgi:HTH-type transcriptional regulator / antitoxin HigA